MAGGGLRNLAVEQYDSGAGSLEKWQAIFLMGRIVFDFISGMDRMWMQ